MSITGSALIDENGKLFLNQNPVTLIASSQKTTDTTVSVSVKTTILSLNFTAPKSGKVEICGLANGSLGNNVNCDWFIDLYLAGVAIGSNPRVFSNHGHALTPLNGAFGHAYYSGLTSGATYEARISVTPVSGTVNIRSSTNPTKEQAQLIIRLAI